MSANIPTDAAVEHEALARRLYEIMDRIDPVPSPEWDGLDDDNREFYREAIRRLLFERELLQAVLGLPATTR